MNEEYNGFRMMDGVYVASFSDLIGFNMLNGKELGRTKAEISQWNTKIIALPHDLFATCSVKIKIWRRNRDTDKLVYVRELVGHDKIIFDVIFLGSNFICSAGSDKTLRIWNITNGICTKMIRGNAVFGKLSVLSIEKCLFLSASNDGTLKIWNWWTANCLRIFKHRNAVFSVCKLTEDKIIAGLLGNPSMIKIWSISKSKLICSLIHGSGRLYAIEKIDSSRFITGSEDSSIKLWDISKLKESHKDNNNGDTEPDLNRISHISNIVCIRKFVGHSAMVLFVKNYFSTNYFFSCQTGFESKNAIKVWSSFSGNCVKTFEYLSKSLVLFTSSEQLRKRRVKLNYVIFDLFQKIEKEENDNKIAKKRCITIRFIKQKLDDNYVDTLDYATNTETNDRKIEYGTWKVPKFIIPVENSRNNEIIIENRIFENYGDLKRLYELFSYCIYGEDDFIDQQFSEAEKSNRIHGESLFFQLFQLFLILRMRYHAILVLKKIRTMQTNHLVYCFIQSILPKMSSKENIGSLESFEYFSNPFSKTKSLDLNLRNVLNFDDNNNSISNGNSTSTPLADSPIFLMRKNMFPQNSNINTTQNQQLNNNMCNGNQFVRLPPLPFETTRFDSPFTSVCFRELKKRRIEISRHPEYLELLEQVGMLKNIYFYREEIQEANERNPFETSRREISSVVEQYFAPFENTEKTHEDLKKNFDIGMRKEQLSKLNFQKLFHFECAKLYQNPKKHSNIILRTKDGFEFFAHKEILCARSDFFFRMDNFGGVESNGKYIDIAFLSSSQLRVFLNWLYTGNLFHGTQDFQESDIFYYKHIINSYKDPDKLDKAKIEKCVYPLIGLYEHCEMYFEEELGFILRAELIDLFNLFGKKKQVIVIGDEVKINDKMIDENESVDEIEHLLLRIGHVLDSIPEKGKDIILSTDWICKNKISWRTIRVCIESSVKVKELSDRIEVLEEGKENSRSRIRKRSHLTVENDISELPSPKKRKYMKSENVCKPGDHQEFDDLSQFVI